MLLVVGGLLTWLTRLPASNALLFIVRYKQFALKQMRRMIKLNKTGLPHSTLAEITDGLPV